MKLSNVILGSTILFLYACGGGGGGTPGAPGLPGSVWRNGDNPPSNSLGVNGDYYLDNLDGFVYKKISRSHYKVCLNFT